MQFVDGKYWTIVRPLPPSTLCSTKGRLVYFPLNEGKRFFHQPPDIYIYICIPPDFSSASTLNKSVFKGHHRVLVTPFHGYVNLMVGHDQWPISFPKYGRRSPKNSWCVCVYTDSRRKFVFDASLGYLPLSWRIQSPITGYVDNEFLRRDPLWNSLQESRIYPANEAWDRW